MKKLLLGFAAALALASTAPVQAQVRITEVASWSSSSVVGADWFELTNFGSSAVNISGWKMDDNSTSFSSAVALTGISSIGAGQSVIFIEDTNGTSPTPFVNTWFGGSAPAGLQIGFYGGSGVGLSTSGDAVDIFNASGVSQALLFFGTATTGVTFDNSNGAVNGNTAGTAFTTLSQLGVHGAFKAVGDSTELGSPGLIAAVPEPGSYALMIAGLALLGGIARRRNQA